MALITSLILTYKRNENLKKVIAGIRNQTVSSEIWLWDNYGQAPADGVDVMFRSTRNFYCQPRQLIAGLVQSEYIYNQDDDLALLDKCMFEKFIEHSKKYPDFVIGWNGRIFSRDIDWNKAYSFPGKGWVDAWSEDNAESIDMINYGVSFLRTELINQVPINPFHKKSHSITEKQMKYADDIWVSNWFAKKRTMPFKLRDSYEWLNEYEERGAALSKQSEHMSVRDGMVDKFFSHKRTA